MGVRNSITEQKACMFDSVTGTAFGPVFDSEDALDDFLEYCETEAPTDLRILSDGDLNVLVGSWRTKCDVEDAEYWASQT